jgi:hypothetical protein
MPVNHQEELANKLSGSPAMRRHGHQSRCNFLKCFDSFFNRKIVKFVAMKALHSFCSFLMLCFLLSGCDAFDCEHDQPITQDLEQWAPYGSNQELHFKTAALVDEYLDVKLFEHVWENADTDCTDDVEYIKIYISARNSFQDSLSINIRNNVLLITCSSCDELTEIKFSKASGIVEYTANGLVYNRVF